MLKNSKPLCIFWVDASHEIGFGHASRCISICETMSSFFEIIVVSRYELTFQFFQKFQNHKLSSNLIDAQKEFLTILKRTPPKVIVTDFTYNLKINFFRDIKQTSNLLICIGNISPGIIYADMVLFPALHYEDSILPETINKDSIRDKIFHGKDWVILNDEVLKISNSNYQNSGIVVATGGTDPYNIFYKLWEIFDELEVECNFLVGEGFRRRNKIPANTSKINTYPFSIKQLNNSKLIVSAFGQTILEGLYLKKNIIGIPHNQSDTISSKNLEKNIPQYFDAGYYADLNIKKMNNLLTQSMQSPILNNNSIIDGKGRQRFTDWILENLR